LIYYIILWILIFDENWYAEVLDEDKNINKRVSEIQIKNLPKKDGLLLKKQLNKTEIQKLNLYVSNIRKILEQKASISKLMLSYNISNW
jgi:hypothetical protein